MSRYLLLLVFCLLAVAVMATCVRRNNVQAPAAPPASVPEPAGGATTSSRPQVAWFGPESRTGGLPMGL